MTKHTPTPWKVTGSTVIVAADFGWKGAVVATVSHRDLGTNTFDTLRAEANAELIVRAVNAHADLLAALTAAPIPSAYHGVRGFEVERFLADYDAFMDQRRAAIAKAEGREG